MRSSPLWIAGLLATVAWLPASSASTVNEPQAGAPPYRISGTARLGGESLNLDVPFSISGQLTPQQVLAAGLRGAAALIPQR